MSDELNTNQLAQTPPPSSGKSTLKIPHTDIETAEQFVGKYKRTLYYVHAWKSWVRWDGLRWAKDDDEGAVRMAMSLAADYKAEAKRLGTEKGEAHFKASVKLARGKAIREMLTLGRSLVPRKSEDFDADPNLLNTPLGTVMLSSGGYYTNLEDDYISRMTNAGYDGVPSECPTWLKFLHTVTGGNTNLMDFIQRAVGYSLTGQTKERVAFVLHGEGRNGKSTFLETIQAAMGDYATTASSNLIMAGRDEKTYNDLAALRGVRFVAASENKRGKAVDTGIFKLITGNEKVSARFLYGEWFTFKPQFKLWLATNHLPEIEADDQAVWDRMRLIPFTVRIPDDQVDDQLGKKLEAELPGILRWAIEGATIWYRDGLGTSDAVKIAAENWRHDADLLGQWVSEACEVGALTAYRTGALYESFRTFAKSTAPASFNMRLNEFVDAMQRKGYKRVMKTGNRSFLEGIALRQGNPETGNDEF